MKTAYDIGLDTRELFESPKDIDPIKFWADDPKRNQGYLSKLKDASDFKQIDTFNGFPIYASGSFIFSTSNDGKIGFMVQWIEHPFPGNKGQAVVQIAVWRERFGLQEGITKYVFWNHLYTKRKAVMTDSAQTMYGRGFWRARLGEAVQKGIPVYFLDFPRAKARRLGPVNDLDAAVSEVYGSDDRHRDLRVLISETPPTGFNITEAKKSVILL